MIILAFIVGCVVCPLCALALMLRSEEKMLAKEKARRREVYRQIYAK
jgi:tRNA A37 threonylcarbamoyladenosine modification protein TsaB